MSRKSRSSDGPDAAWARPRTARRTLQGLRSQVFDPGGAKGVRFAPGSFNPDRERWDLQRFIGRLATWVVFASLGLVVVVWAVMAIKGEPASDIKSATEAMQPFLLPPIGAIVGFALGEKVARSRDA